MKIIELKSAIMKIKNLLLDLKNCFNREEETVSELEDKSRELFNLKNRENVIEG